MTGQAVVFTARNTVEFREVKIPEPGSGDVVVRVTHSWISNGTEGSFLRQERKDGETPWQEGDPSPFPLVPGYQKVGVVEAVRDEITDVAVGETVFVAMSKVDLEKPTMGGHVSPAVAPRSQVWKIDPGTDPVAFSGLVLTQVGYNCGARPSVAPGDCAVVIGDGMVGQWAAQTLRWRGAHVLLLGRRPERLQVFAAMSGAGDGLCQAVNMRDVDIMEAVKRFAPGGVQVLVDSVGSVATIEMLFPLLRRNSHIVSAGFNGPHGHIDIQMLRKREATLHSPSGWDHGRMCVTAELIALGYLQTLPLITHRMPAAEAPRAWDIILNRTEPHLGIILEWPGHTPAK